jgi:hypothetical protein
MGPSSAQGLLSPAGSASGAIGYQTKKGRIQNWSNLFKKNHGLNTEMLLPGFEPRKDSNSFVLSIKNV